MVHRRCCRVIVTVVAALALAAVPVGAATQSQYAAAWSVKTGPNWTPAPPNTSPLGAPNPNCTGGINPMPPGGEYAEFTFSGFSVTDPVAGVEVRVKYRGNGLSAQLINGGLIGSAQPVAAYIAQPANCNNTVFNNAGGAADLWGTGGISAAAINSGSFGVRLSISGNTADIDAVEMVVHFGVVDSPPTANAGGPYGGNEGSAIGVDGSGSTDDIGITTYEWDCANDGTFEISSGSSGATCTYPDDGVFTAALRVTDTIGQQDTATATVTVANVAPTIQLAGTPVPVDEGSPFSLTLGTITDPGTDTVTQWIVKWGDGTTDTYASGGVKMHTYGDGPASPLILVDLVDEDGTHSPAGALSLTVNNVAPTVAEPVVVPEPSEEGSSVTASATFTDPGADDSPFTCTVDYGEGGGAEPGTVSGSTCDGPSHAYGDDGTYSVNVCVEDKDGGQGCESVDHVVENVAPTVAAPVVAPEPSDEGAAVTASATFTDPGTDDSPFSCTVDYDTSDAVAAVAGTVSGMTCTGDSYAYGDNGTFTVEICVTDKDGGEGCADSDHVVENVAPEVTLDTSGAITFPSGDDAFIGRQGDEQSHTADAEDPGSDDLTFTWDFGFPGSSTTYYNDTGDPFGTPDPLPSPGGIFPFSASDTDSVTFADPGVYTVRVDVTDDDGGADFDDLPKLVTGNGRCAYSQGFWRHQFRGRGKPHFDTPTLQAYLDLVDFASGVFSELVAASIPAEAQAVFAPGGSFRDKATRQALAAWLNWASGGVAWDEGIDLDGDMAPDIQFSALIAMVEAILLDPGASHADLELAKDLAEAVNLLDESTSGCNPRAGTRLIVR